ncbi:kelch repeat-containing protein [Actinomadura sp. NPDC000600]|uniref:Kelch repeat-containing protein n=1 Tax=Actinomadura sp. NPDC000600 TaxID=3154262 RepID=UPI003395D3C6
MTSPTVAATGQWTSTGALPSARVWSGQHDGPVVLAGGKVLVAGGAGAAGEGLGQVSLYDPVAKTWTAAAALHTARRLHTVTLLGSGKVLVTGGITGAATFPSAGLASAEVFDPAQGTWTATGSLKTGRWGHSAALLPDGRVLVAGGCTTRSGQSVKALCSAEVYDPDTAAWTEVTAMTDARCGHPALVLNTGKVLVVGGSAPVSRETDAALAFCELYDPASGTGGTWTPTGSLPAARSGHQATLLPDGTVLASGGSPPGAPGNGTFDPFSRATAETFNPVAGAWSAVQDMPAGRGLHRSVSLGGGKILVAGGTDTPDNGVGYASALIFDAATRSWSPAGGLATGRWGFAAVPLTGGTVLVTGGITRAGLAAADSAATEVTATSEIFSTGPVTP